MREEQLREVSERVHERSESALSGGAVAGGSKYIAMSPKSGGFGGNSRVVTIKE